MIGVPGIKALEMKTRLLSTLTFESSFLGTKLNTKPPLMANATALVVAKPSCEMFSEQQTTVESR